MKLRSRLYKTARAIGNVNAFVRGPDAMIRRAGRKALWRIAARVIRRIIP